MKEIFSENPEAEQWQLLLRFSYIDNIRKYLDSNGFKSNSGTLLEIIANSYQQAFEYFKASESVSLNISPLLLYYGATNLLFGTACLLKGCTIPIKNHGMQLLIPPDKLNRLGDVTIKIRDPLEGAFNNLNRTFSKFIYSPKGEIWSLIESLGSILELKDDFENVYENDYFYSVPLQIIRKKEQIFWRLDKKDLGAIKTVDELLSLIPEFNKNYLPPIENKSKLILRKKLNGFDLSETSISGLSYFQLSNIKNKKLITIPLISKLFIGLYALGSLSRYYPSIWAPFIKTDSTGEKQIIEKFISLSRRYLPNICLNYLFNKKLIFLPRIQSIEDISDKTINDELRKLIREEVTLLLKENGKDIR